MSKNEDALIPVEQKQIAFYEDEITAVLVEVEGNQAVYIPIKSICEYLGVNWDGQRQRIQRDLVLSEVVMSAVITTADIDPESKRPRSSSMLCLPLDYLNGWLFGISASRVKEEIRDNLVRYQRECYRVLADAFLTPGPTFSDLMETADPNTVEAYHIARAVMKLAQSQIEMESRLQKHIVGLDKRVESIESQLGAPDRLITPAQAAEISQTVKAIAMKMSKRTGRNEYGGVYGEMYRRFEIPSYKELPANKFESCMEWLNDWLQELIQDLPF